MFIFKVQEEIVLKIIIGVAIINSTLNNPPHINFSTFPLNYCNEKSS